jgi:hypothetical protein
VSQSTFTKEQFWAELEALGEEKVLVGYKVEKRWGSPPLAKAELVEIWLKSKEDVRALAASMRRDAREEETLSISKRSAATAEDALSIARDANSIATEQLSAARRNARYAMYAAAVAATAVVASSKDEIYALIARFL